MSARCAMGVFMLVTTLFALGMLSVIVWAFKVGNFFEEGKEIVSLPWGVVSLVDVYTGFLLFIGWVIYREKYLVVALLWAVLILVLGNLVTALYAAIALYMADGDWIEFWLGARRASRAFLAVSN